MSALLPALWVVFVALAVVALVCSALAGASVARTAALLVVAVPAAIGIGSASADLSASRWLIGLAVVVGGAAVVLAGSARGTGVDR